MKGAERAHIDYMSLDTKGGGLEILKCIYYDTCSIKAISVENNYFDGQLQSTLDNQEYFYIGNFKVDNIYIKGGDSLSNALAYKKTAKHVTCDNLNHC